MAIDFARARAPRNEAEALEADANGDEARFLSIAPTSEGTRRREHSRHTVDLDVSVGSDHNFYAGFAENLSAGGVFIATHKLKPAGSRLELSINLPDGVCVRATGEVRWIRVFNEHSDTPPGMGVKFDALDVASAEAIQQFLARREPLFFDED